MSDLKKPGTFSQQEKRFMEANVDKLPPEVIAERLNRRVGTIESYIKDHHLGVKFDSSDEEMGARAIFADLRNKYFYGEVCNQLLPDELKYFQEHWVHFVQQFSAEGEILPSEESELKDLILYDISKNRTLKEEKVSIDRKEALMQDLRSLEEKEDDTLSSDEKKRKRALRQEVSSLENGMRDCRKRFSELCRESDKLRASLYSSRAQRTKDLERAGLDFAGLLKNYEDYQQRKAAARSMELVAKAEAKERERLSAYNTYADNTVDRPILNAESINDED